MGLELPPQGLAGAGGLCTPACEPPAEKSGVSWRQRQPRALAWAGFRPRGGEGSKDRGLRGTQTLVSGAAQKDQLAGDQLYRPRGLPRTARRQRRTVPPQQPPGRGPLQTSGAEPVGGGRGPGAGPGRGPWARRGRWAGPGEGDLWAGPGCGQWAGPRGAGGRGLGGEAVAGGRAHLRFSLCRGRGRFSPWYSPY